MNKFIFFAILLAVFTFSCQESSTIEDNDIAEDILIENRQADVGAIQMTLQDAQLDEEFTKILEGLNLDITSQGLIALGDYIVETHTISKNVAEENVKVSFTFPIKLNPNNSSNDVISNLVLYRIGETFYSKIIEYTIPFEDLLAVINHEVIDTVNVYCQEYNVDPNILEFRGCTNIYIWVYTPCGCSPSHSWDQRGECNCHTRGYPTRQQQWVRWCTDGNGDTGDSFPILPTNTDGGSTDGAGGQQTGGNGNHDDDEFGTELLINTKKWYDTKINNLASKYGLSISLLETTVPISCMGNGNPTTGEFEACAKSTLIDELNIQITSTQKQWVIENFEVFSSLWNFKGGNSHLLEQSKLDALETYIGLLESDEDFREYALVEHPALPSWAWVFIRDIGIEVAKELAKKYGPAGVVDDVVDAVGNLGQGDILGFLGEVIDIVRRKIPALAAVSLTLDGIELGGKASKVWKAISRMEQFGEQVINKFMNVIKSTGGSILDKLKYVDNATGIKLSNVGSPEGFFDNFQNAIEDAFSDVVILSPTQLAPFELAGFKFNNNVIRVAIKYGGNTNPNGYTLEMKWGSQNQPLKFRFL